MAAHPGPVLVTGANSGTRGRSTWGTARSEAKAEELRAAADEAGCAERVRPLVLDGSDHARVVGELRGLLAVGRSREGDRRAGARSST